jgi:hypothetical protein
MGTNAVFSTSARPEVEDDWEEEDATHPAKRGEEEILGFEVRVLWIRWCKKGLEGSRCGIIRFRRWGREKLVAGRQGAGGGGQNQVKKNKATRLGKKKESTFVVGPRSTLLEMCTAPRLLHAGWAIGVPSMASSS